jgi:hypothetical protein
MKMYKELINLTPYLGSIRVIENVITIDVLFPQDWKILKKYVDEKSVVENDSPDQSYRAFSFVCELSEENFTNIYTSVINVIKYNKEREEKDRLFQEKVNELKGVFEKQSLDELKDLKFNILKETKTKVNVVENDEN